MRIIVSKQYPLYSPQFWKCYFVQMRPYLLFVSGIAGAAGIAMSKQPDQPGWKIYAAMIPFFLGYGFGQALTDCFQTDTDKISAPYRPLSQGVISIRDVLIVSITGLLASGILFYILHPVCFLLSLFAVFGLSTYSYIKKNFWFAGPLYNAAIVAVLPVMGYFSNRPASGFNLPSEWWPYLLVTFSSYASFVLIGYLKDIEADRATGYKTFPVLFGWNKTTLVGDLLAVITLTSFWMRPIRHIPEIILAVSATIIIIYGQLFAHITKNKTETGALIPILATVRSFILLHMAIVLHFVPQWLIPALLFYGLFEWTLKNRPSKYQV